MGSVSNRTRRWRRIRQDVVRRVERCGLGEKKRRTAGVAQTAARDEETAKKEGNINMDSPSEHRDGFSHAATAGLEVLEATYT